MPREGRGRGRGFGSKGGAPKGRGRGISLGKPALPGGLQEVEQPSSTEPWSGPFCMICDEPMRVSAIGRCNHAVCHVCALRVRVLADKGKKSIEDSKEAEIKWPCAVCRTSLDQITLTEDPDAKYGVPTLGLGLKEYGVLCTSREAFDAAQTVLSFSCSVCKESGTPSTFKTEDELTRHVVRTHQLFYCDVCTDNQKLFLHEHTLYNRKDLIKHKRSKNSAGVEMHPKCQFCDIRFFDVDALMIHLSQKHEYCSFCEQAGKPSQYFRNYKSIEQHFMNDHFLCMDPICRREKFVAFGTELDYQAHMAKVHGSNAKSDKIDMRLLMEGGGGAGGRAGSGGGGFNSHSGFFGEAPAPNFGPPPVDLGSGPSLQAAAAMSRGQRVGASGPPPTAQAALRRALGASEASGGVDDASWGGGTRNRAPQVDDFPALGGGGGGGGGSGRSGGGGGGGGYRLAAGNGGGGGRSAIPVHHRSVVVTSSESDFPTLGGPGPRAATHNNLPRAKSKPKQKAVSSAQPVQIQSTQVDNYPSLGGSRSSGANSSRRTVAAQPPAYNNAATASGGDDGWSIAGPSAVSREAAPQPVRAAPQRPPAPGDFPTLGGRGGGDGGAGAGAGWVGSSKASEKPRRTPGPLGPFTPPPNFDKRNVALIGMINNAVDKAQFAAFKAASMAFRRGASTPTQYFDSCASIFGAQMATIFPELLALLPDVQKQNALYTVALEAQTSPYKSVDSGVFALIECETCGQIVLNTDAKAHLETHPVIVEEAFPGLPPSNPQGGSKKKKKKKKGGGGGGGGGGGPPAGSWGTSNSAVRGADGDYKGVQRKAEPQWGGGGGRQGW